MDLMAFHISHVLSWTVAGFFAISACFISLRHIYLHGKYYTRPELQKFILVILFMIPVSAIGSWLSLRFKEHSMYIDLIRDCYEAFVIYSFVELLIGYGGGEKKLLETLEKHPPMHHMFPFNFLPHFRTNKRFLSLCQLAVIQYVFVKPSMALLAIILDENGLYGEGKFEWDRGYGYITFINNIAVTIAMYGLLYFYHAISEDLEHISPLKKLLCVKAVLFVSFWQGVVIAVLAKYGLIHSTVMDTLEEVETELQDFMICFEMVFAAIAHNYAYSYFEFMKSEKKKNK